MIPLSLTMRNFMCYGEQASSLDLSGVHLACLAGDNGHGKSAIIDAMTWALWGKGRVSRDDDLVHLGAREMEVDLEFRLGDSRYRVIRQRQKNGTRGRTSLEFQVLDGTELRSLTSNTIRQTQAAIIDTLHMEYDTFINSAFLLQGRADEFTSRPPAERKRILGEILDLSYYDYLEERAKQFSKEADLRLRGITATLQEMQKELSRRPEYEEDLHRAERAASELTSRLRAEEESLRDLRAKKKELDLRQEESRGLESRKQQCESELARAKQEIENSDSKIASYQEILARGPTIEAGYQQLLDARKTEAELSRKLTRQARLSEQRGELLRIVDAARSQLSVERQRLTTTLSSLESTAGRAESLERKLKEVREQLEHLAARIEERDRLLAQEQELSNQEAALAAHNQQLKSEMGLLKEKLVLLEDAEAFCPLCGSELEDEERENIERSYEREGTEKGDLYRQHSAAIERLKQEISDIRRTRDQADAEVSSLASLKGEEVSLARALEEARTAAGEFTKTNEDLQSLDRRLEENDFAPEERQPLKDLDEQLASIAYDANRHEEVRIVMEDSAHFEAENRDLESARQSLDAEREKVAERKERRAQLQREVDDLSGRMAVLQERVQELREAARDLDALRSSVEQLQIDEADARLRLGAARQRLDHCLHLDEESEEKSRQEKETQQEKAIYDELRLAFGKKGVQAMIIEAVIPEIEDDANHLLARMTDGRLNVRLKSQRETLKGDSVETLTIEVADELGARDYALFSGGEAFRVNFAIRVALSKLLARRAGARLQTLIVDEGFGTQDAQGRDRLVEAINSIQDDFELILVITHLEELKDAFPVRIDVFKTPEGSQISMV
jgi:exonuclease SbcC